MIFSDYDDALSRRSDTAGFDLAKAFRLCSQAAEKGCSDAQLLLGSVYARGLGVEADPDKAELWFAEADRNGEPLAVFYSFLTKTGLIRYRSTPGCMNGLY